MRTNPLYRLSNVCGQSVMLLPSSPSDSETTMLTFNESAAYLWQKMSALPSFTEDDMSAALLAEYEVSPSDASRLAHEQLSQWQSLHLLVE